MKFILLLFLFCGQNLYAKTHYILMDPGPTSYQNYYRYYNSIRYAYEILRSKNHNPIVLVNDGEWRLPEEATWAERLLAYGIDLEAPIESTTYPKYPILYPPVHGRAASVNDITAAVNGLHLEKGDTVVFYLTGHGLGATDPRDPSTASISMWQENNKQNPLYYKDLEKAVAKLPKNIFFKFVTIQCFGGGIHSIARKLDNFCASSTTSHQVESISGSMEESIYGKAFWSAFANGENFATINLKALAADTPKNLNLGRLSSYDYVEYVLQTGPYKRLYANEEFYYTDKPYMPSDFQFATSPLSSIYQIPNLTSDLCCVADIVKNDIDSLPRLEALLHDLTKISKNVSSIQVKTIFHSVIDDMKRNGLFYLELAEGFDQKNKNISDIQTYVYNHQVLNLLDQLSVFNKKANRSQKKKFTQLLQCEWQTL